VTDKPSRAEKARAFGFETRQLHAGQRPDPNTGARAVPIFQTTSYVFEDPESAAAYFNLQEYGNTYSRIMNPTVAVFEERVANLEGGCGGVAFASGIAAQAAALFTLLQPGDHVVSSSALYGGTVNQLKHLLRKMSVELTWVDPDDPGAWRKAVRASTKAFFGETIGNPAGNVLDIEAVASIAHEHELPLIVDNTFATPYLCRPIEWGADIVIHSATKFIGGHGTSIGGVVVEAGTFDWSNGRFPVVADPSPAYHGLQFHETFGMYGYLMKLRAETLRDLGAALAPFNAFLFLQGLETLSLRMERHVDNARAVAAFLESHELASNVTYPGLPTSRYRPLVEKYLPLGAGAVFSFDCAGGRTGGQDLISGVTLWSHLANVGDAKSLIIHPASTTHRQLGDDELRAAGVGPGTVRLSVGTESVSDLIWDLEQGFALVAGQDRSRAVPGPADDPAGAPHGQHDRGRRPIEQRTAGQQLRWLLPQATRLPGGPGESPRDRDPRAEVLREPAGHTRAGGRGERLPRATCPAGDRPGGGGDPRRRPLVPVRRGQRGGRADRQGRWRDGDHGSLPQS
jgi:O-acetylhomoserine (thiol)-lyase